MSDMSEMKKEVIEDFKDPHVILEIVRELDDSMARSQKEKSKLLAKYQSLMKGYEEHYHMVVNRPEEVMPDSPYDEPSIARRY